jgi:hypothetical protein
MFRRLKFFGIGAFSGVILLLFIFNKKDTKCAYFPNERVIDEILYKPMVIAPGITLTEKQLREEFLPACQVDFEKSKVEQQPCRLYIAKHKTTQQEIKIELCKDEAKVISISPTKP